jgi:hypothetical protein
LPGRIDGAFFPELTGVIGKSEPGPTSPPGLFLYIFFIGLSANDKVGLALNLGPFFVMALCAWFYMTERL